MLRVYAEPMVLYDILALKLLDSQSHVTTVNFSVDNRGHASDIYSA